MNKMNQYPAVTKQLLAAMDVLADAARMYYSALMNDPDFRAQMAENDQVGKILREAMETNYQAIDVVVGFVDRYEAVDRLT